MKRIDEEPPRGLRRRAGLSRAGPGRAGLSRAGLSRATDSRRALGGGTATHMNSLAPQRPACSLLHTVACPLLRPHDPHDGR
ncbi:hypothetical protein [Streptomyces europaeiscabiei]|uniref:hypothetical protein n=1 Tax=Streptomyces europaeiscabiei TaxID=146819 RepID=UPI0029A7F5D7|nr:hypothetical protein [Streptomyces europaeiscabiei]MDX3587895.1 hypothetical protein [Streptomyces europaeiscabiei]